MVNSIREKRTQRVLNKMKKIHKKHDKKLAKEKCNEYFIFPNYSDDIHNVKQTEVANVYTLRCLNRDISMDKKLLADCVFYLKEVPVPSPWYVVPRLLPLSDPLCFLFSRFYSLIYFKIRFFASLA